MSNTFNATRERIVSAFIERLRGIEITEDQHNRIAHAIWVASIRARARGKLEFHGTTDAKSSQDAAVGVASGSAPPVQDNGAPQLKWGEYVRWARYYVTSTDLDGVEVGCKDHHEFRRDNLNGDIPALLALCDEHEQESHS